MNSIINNLPPNVKLILGIVIFLIGMTLIRTIGPFIGGLVLGIGIVLLLNYKQIIK